MSASFVPFSIPPETLAKIVFSFHLRYVEQCQRISSPSFSPLPALASPPFSPPLFSSSPACSSSSSCSSTPSFLSPYNRPYTAAKKQTPPCESQQQCACSVCGKTFSRQWLLQGHMRTHTGEKPFSCHVCGKAFADKSNLRAHVQTHSVVKRFGCSVCGKRFALKSYLSKHEESACLRRSH